MRYIGFRDEDDKMKMTLKDSAGRKAEIEMDTQRDGLAICVHGDYLDNGDELPESEIKWINENCGADMTEAQCDYDPTPYCSYCGAMSSRNCDCGPIAENN
jgi:hypothetical protein